MDLRPAFAALGYSQARPATTPAPSAMPSASGALSRAADRFAETLASGEETARAALMGKADPHALVEALASSQLAVETVATVRDRVVEAYQEILRMPV